MSAELEFGQWLRVVVPLGVVLVAAFGCILVARKYLKGTRAGHGQTEGFSLEELQEMHRNGQIFDDEFKRMKEKFIRDLK